MRSKVRLLISTILAAVMVFGIPMQYAHADPPETQKWHLAFDSSYEPRNKIDLTAHPTGDVPGGGTYSYDAGSQTITFTSLTATVPVQVRDLNVVFKGKNIINNNGDRVGFGISLLTVPSVTVSGESLTDAGENNSPGWLYVEDSINGLLTTMPRAADEGAFGGKAQVNFKNLKITVKNPESAKTYSDVRGLQVYGSNNPIKMYLEGTTSLDVDLSDSKARSAIGIKVWRKGTLTFANDGNTIIKAPKPIEANYPEDKDALTEYDNELTFAGCGVIRAEKVSNATNYSAISYTQLHYPQGIHRDAKYDPDQIDFVPMERDQLDRSLPVEFGHYADSDEDSMRLYGYYRKGHSEEPISDLIVQPKSTYTEIPAHIETDNGGFSKVRSVPTGKCTSPYVVWRFYEESAKPTSNETKFVVDPLDGRNVAFHRGIDEQTKHMSFGSYYGPDSKVDDAAVTGVDNSTDQIAYAVIFDTNGGSANPDVQKAAPNQLITQPADPTKPGAKFLGWYKVKAPMDKKGYPKVTEVGKKPFDFKNSLINETTFLRAKWDENVVSTYDLTFDLNGGESSAPANQKVNQGGKAIKPIDPVREGYVFDGWKDKVWTNDEYRRWDFAKDTVEANTDLVAQWKDKYSSVVFRNGDQIISDQKVKYGEYAKTPETPTAPEFTFKCWRERGVTPTCFDVENTPIKKSTTLIPLWEKKVFTVHFDTNGGDGNYPDQKIQYAGRTQRPSSDPTYAGHSFLGWFFKDSNGYERSYDFDLPITQDYDLYAKWLDKEANKHNVIFDLRGGQGTGDYSPQNVADGDTAIEPSPAPSREGYTFIDWVNQSGEVWDFTKPVTSDLKLHADWKAIEYKISFDANNSSWSGTKEIQIAYGEKIPKPDNPTREHYSFAGWYAGDKEWIFDLDIVTKPVNLKIVNHSDIYAEIDDS